LSKSFENSSHRLIFFSDEVKEKLLKEIFDEMKRQQSVSADVRCYKCLSSRYHTFKTFLSFENSSQESML